jgi:thioredoxin reductase (NADPH)
LDVLFTTRGDVYHNQLAENLGAKLSPEGEIIVDADQRATVSGVYAAGCVTPANCQMIIAAGQGAVAAQAINRDLFEESLENHSLRRLRAHQITHEQTMPETTVQPV